jgi:predicted aspartyl protease
MFLAGQRKDSKGRMSMRSGIWIASLLELAGLVATSSAAAECKLLKLGELPVTVQRNQLLVPASVNGQKFMMVADTGAGITLLDGSVAKAAQLNTQGARGMRMIGVGGEMQVDWAMMDDLTIGGVKFPARRFLVNKSGGGAQSSLLGYDFFSLFDVEIDARNGKINLFKTEACGDANMAYWAPDRADMVELISKGTPQVTVRVDGQPITATLDSGAGTTVIAQRLATFMGAEPAPDAQKRSGVGGDGRRVEGVLHKFKSFEIGDEQINNPTLTVLDALKTGFTSTGSRISSSGIADMLLGFDFLRTHRVFISNSEKKLYFTYEGGTVFAPSPSNPASKP